MGRQFAEQFGLQQYSGKFARVFRSNNKILKFVDDGSSSSRELREKSIKEKGVYEPIAAHPLHNTTLQILATCLTRGKRNASVPYLQANAMRKAMPTYQFTMLYSLIMAVTNVAKMDLKKLNSTLGSSSKIDKYQRYKTLYKRSLDFINMLSSFSCDLVAVGAHAEIGYQSYMTDVCVRRLDSREESTWMELYKEKGQYFHQAALIANPHSGLARGMRNGKIAGKNNTVGKGMFGKEICRFYQIGTCNPQDGPCPFRHVCAWCFGNKKHGMKNCNDFLAKSGLSSKKFDKDKRKKK